jgi:hypothetical protein
MDSFEQTAKNDRLKMESDKQNCVDIAKKICGEINNQNSALRGIINKNIEKSYWFTISDGQIPKELVNDFNKLCDCSNRYKNLINSELNKASKYLKVSNYYTCGEYVCENKPGLNIQYSANKSFK